MARFPGFDHEAAVQLPVDVFLKLVGAPPKDSAWALLEESRLRSRCAWG